MSLDGQFLTFVCLSVFPSDVLREELEWSAYAYTNQLWISTSLLWARHDHFPSQTACSSGAGLGILWARQSCHAASLSDTNILGVLEPDPKLRKGSPGVTDKQEVFSDFNGGETEKKRVSDFLKLSWRVRARDNDRTVVPHCLFNMMDPETLLVLKLLSLYHLFFFLFFNFILFLNLT